METDFEELMKKKSADGLNHYLANIDRYVPEAIYAAINELNRRGKVFTDEELQAIKLKINDKIKAQKKEDEAWSTLGWGTFNMSSLGLGLILLYLGTFCFVTKPLTRHDIAIVKGTFKSIENGGRHGLMDTKIKEHENRFRIYRSAFKYDFSSRKEGDKVQILINKGTSAN